MAEMCARFVIIMPCSYACQFVKAPIKFNDMQCNTCIMYEMTCIYLPGSHFV